MNDNAMVQFTLSDDIYLRLEEDDIFLQEYPVFVDKLIYWCSAQEKTLIGLVNHKDFCYKLIELLTLCIQNKLQLHTSINDDLGYLWNVQLSLSYEDQIKQFYFVDVEEQKDAYWVGVMYQLCETYGNVNSYVMTWLYNDSEGNIVLEVAPLYRWLLQEYDPEEGIPFISYEHFMKQYQPLFKKIIPQSVARIWIEQAKLFSDTEHKVFHSSKN